MAFPISELGTQNQQVVGKLGGETILQYHPYQSPPQQHPLGFICQFSEAYSCLPFPLGTW